MSPIVELARWLFERHHIPYDEEGHAPLIHVPYTLRRKGGVEVPVVVTAASLWKGARETLYGLDSRMRSGEKLFGDVEKTREENIALVEQLLDRLLLSVRRLVYFHILQVRRVVVPVATDGVPRWERALVWAFFPVWRRLMARALDFTPAAIERAALEIGEAFTIVEAELARRRTRSTSFFRRWSRRSRYRKGMVPACRRSTKCRLRSGRSSSRCVRAGPANWFSTPTPRRVQHRRHR